MKSFDQSILANHFERWDSVKEKIAKCYSEKDKEAVTLMQDAIVNYAELLECGGKEVNERTGKSEYKLLALNGTERFEFVKARIKSHYAHVQLDALYTETKKKIARLSVMQKAKSDLRS